ncbi:MAG: hypothetical protein ACON30_02955 [Flavobacteriaceae bacterium]
MELNKHVKEYVDISNQIIGVFMDSVWGFSLLRSDAIKQRKNTLTKNKAYMLMQPLLPPGTPPDFKNALHVATAKQVIERTQPNGKNSFIVARMVIVFIYQYWEDHYREIFAQNLGMTNKSELKIDSLGDIRNLRNCIIHNNSISTKDVEKNKLFKWFKKDELVNIIPEQLNQIKLHFQDSLLIELEDKKKTKS